MHVRVEKIREERVRGGGGGYEEEKYNELARNSIIFAIFSKGLYRIN